MLTSSHAEQSQWGGRHREHAAAVDELEVAAAWWQQSATGQQKSAQAGDRNERKRGVEQAGLASGLSVPYKHHRWWRLGQAWTCSRLEMFFTWHACRHAWPHPARQLSARRVRLSCGRVRPAGERGLAPLQAIYCCAQETRWWPRPISSSLSLSYASAPARPGE